MGEKNASSTADSIAENTSGDFFDIKRPKLKYPEELEKHPRPITYRTDDPYAHLGRIGYTSNRYQFRGTNKDDNNIYGGQHMKKTLWLEEMRRRIIAENHGITADVDDASIAGTAEAYYLKSREKRNPHYKQWSQTLNPFSSQTAKLSSTAASPPQNQTKPPKAIKKL
jgi:hypothetical protein